MTKLQFIYVAGATLYFLLSVYILRSKREEYNEAISEFSSLTNERVANGMTFFIVVAMSAIWFVAVPVKIVRMITGPKKQ